MTIEEGFRRIFDNAFTVVDSVNDRFAQFFNE